MTGLLPRGYDLGNDLRIRKPICSAENWGIYSTSNRGYCLAVDLNTADQWSAFIDLDVFSVDEESGIRLYVCDSEYLVSSLVQGPFPERSAQIQAFSIAFGNFREEYPDVNIEDAIYLEKLGVILPTEYSKNSQSMSLVYGRWLTGGVAIPGSDVAELSAFMSWMPKDALVKCIDTAHLIDDETKESLVKEAEEKKKQAEHPDHYDEDFHLIGRPELEAFFNEHIIDIIRHEEEYSRMGIKFPGATVLYGPPGCGKTYAVDRLAEYLKWPRFNIEAGTVASPYIHDTSKKIFEVFSQAIKAAPSVLVIDEMEAFLSDRAQAGTTGVHHVEEVGEFLRRIPEAIDSHVLIFAMTNMIDQIDPAILRRGRFDHIIEVKMASASEIESLLKSRFKELPVAEDASAAVIAKELEGRPLSDVAFVIKEAGRCAVKQHKEKMDRECFEVALSGLPIEKNKKNTRKIGF